MVIANPRRFHLYANAYKCNACGFIIRAPGIHCNALMVPVVVLDNVLSEPSGENTTIIIREVIYEKKGLGMK